MPSGTHLCKCGHTWEQHSDARLCEVVTCSCTAFRARPMISGDLIRLLRVRARIKHELFGDSRLEALAIIDDEIQKATMDETEALC
jgi:hypothetical protein